MNRAPVLSSPDAERARAALRALREGGRRELARPAPTAPPATPGPAPAAAPPAAPPLPEAAPAPLVSAEAGLVETLEALTAWAARAAAPARAFVADREGLPLTDSGGGVGEIAHAGVLAGALDGFRADCAPHASFLMIGGDPAGESLYLFPFRWREQHLLLGLARRGALAPEPAENLLKQLARFEG